MCCCPAGWVDRPIVKRGSTGTLKIDILCHFRHPKVSETLGWGWLVSHRTCRMLLSCSSMVERYERYPRTSPMALFQRWDPISLLSSLSLPSPEVTLPWILLTVCCLGCVSRSLSGKQGSSHSAECCPELNQEQPRVELFPGDKHCRREAPAGLRLNWA